MKFQLCQNVLNAKIEKYILNDEVKLEPGNKEPNPV